MTSAAYTVGRHSVTEVLAVDCPKQLFPQRYRRRWVCLGEKAVYGTSRREFSGARESQPCGVH